MRIGINLIQYTAFHGVESYTKSLLQELFAINKEDEFVLFTNQNSSKIFDFKASNVRVVEKRFKRLSRIGLICYQQIPLLFKLKKEKIDILYCPSIASPMLYRNKVVTIHDCAAARFNEESDLISRIYLSVAYFSATYFSKKIVTVSDFSKRELVDIYHIPASHIAIVSAATAQLPAVTDSFIGTVRDKFKIDKPYFLYMGNIYPRKNLAGMLGAFAVFLKKNPGFYLVLAGRINDPDFIGKNTGHLSVQGSVIQTGFVSEEEKVALYKGAAGHVFPSLYEGFGLSVLEANATGVPVITSNLPPMTEVGGVAALYVDPHDTGAIAKAMEDVISDTVLREKLIAKGYENVKRFSWKRSAALLLRILQNSAA